jgi:hypothetical protein
MVVKKEGLGTALAFVVAGSRSDGVHISPVRLRLRMDIGITIDLRGRGLEDFDFQSLSQSKHIHGTDDRGLGRLHRIKLVMDRRSWAGEVVDFVHLNIEWVGHIVAKEFKVFVVQQVMNISSVPSEKVVDTQHFVSFLEEAVTQVATQKTATAAY